MAQEVWSTLQDLFAAQSTTHVMQTQFQLATLKKGAQSITIYFYKAKRLANALSAAGKVLSNSKFSVYLLVGLGIDYESLVTSLTTRPNPLSPHEILSYLYLPRHLLIFFPMLGMK